MNARFAIYATAILILMVGLLLLRSTVDVIPQANVNAFLDPNDIRGMEVVYNGSPYTLNFQQQQELTDIINRMIPVGKLHGNTIPPPGFEKIVIYLFGKKPVELTPVDIQQDELSFKSSQWNPDGFLTDISAGYMWRLIESSHDP